MQQNDVVYIQTSHAGTVQNPPNPNNKRSTLCPHLQHTQTALLDIARVARTAKGPRTCQRKLASHQPECDRTRLMVPVPGHTTKKTLQPHPTERQTTHACVCQRLPTLALCTNTGPTDFRPTVRTPVPLDPPPAFINRSSSTECFATWTRNLDTEQCPHQCKHQGTRQRSHYRAHSSATTSFGAGGRDRQAGAKATAAHNDSAAKLQTGKQPCLTATVAKRG
jgi:hypothetical protein